MSQAPNQPDRSFEQGGLPDKARARVSEAASERARFFTSTFTVSELAVSRLAGYAPIGQVMGSSIYHVGWRGGGGLLSTATGGSENGVLTEAQHHARSLALGRMEAEAEILGADAVIGVALALKRYGWAEGLIEFSARGTAVRIPGSPPNAKPVLTDLTAQELYKLELAGLWPLGIAMGNCSWYDPHADCATDGNWFNRELTRHTVGLAQTQSLANQRFHDDVVRLGGEGAVGVNVLQEHHDVEWGGGDNSPSHTAFHAQLVLFGTVVHRRRAPQLPRPRLVLDLRDRQVELTALASSRSNR